MLAMIYLKSLVSSNESITQLVQSFKDGNDQFSFETFLKKDSSKFSQTKIKLVHFLRTSSNYQIEKIKNEILQFNNQLEWILELCVFDYLVFLFS